MHPLARQTESPLGFLGDTKLSVGARLLFAVIGAIAGTAGVCAPGIETLSSAVGKSRRSILLYLDELEAAGAIARQRHGQGALELRLAKVQSATPVSTKVQSAAPQSQRKVQPTALHPQTPVRNSLNIYTSNDNDESPAREAQRRRRREVEKTLNDAPFEVSSTDRAAILATPDAHDTARTPITAEYVAAKIAYIVAQNPGRPSLWLRRAILENWSTTNTHRRSVTGTTPPPIAPRPNAAPIISAAPIAPPQTSAIEKIDPAFAAENMRRMNALIARLSGGKFVNA